MDVTSLWTGDEAALLFSKEIAAVYDEVPRDNETGFPVPSHGMKHEPSETQKRKKEFIFTWAFEAFDRDPTFCAKPMFGCLAAYLRGRMVMVLTEDPGERSYREKRYSFDIWDGILLPAERDCHASMRQEFADLVPQPVLGKWLYLPAKNENFESVAREVGRRVACGDSRLGIDPKIKLPKSLPRHPVRYKKAKSPSNAPNRADLKVFLLFLSGSRACRGPFGACL